MVRWLFIVMIQNPKENPHYCIFKNVPSLVCYNFDIKWTDFDNFWQMMLITLNANKKYYFPRNLSCESTL